ncbi:mitochondrial PGP phosphatase [Lobosporangium transversale]|uniref:Mitochondrial PGP phosphatase n=1 Tax=Lobosporangium transversale TaxID=64571 RepID=A0A1Y2GFD7_9FUNG|nr:mitochondrial PGP phosphatase [Lobosporangium transversale]ORZ09331.1 mitochondrial PGP phosphatase [Lobosporangium transversale]|eukprot:XP_021878784.1 mitochondrial PGP phosphatase [Lobosporangium transversale]
MGQSFNLQGILQAFRVLASPRLMVPHLIVRDVRDINFEQLHRSGIIAIAFDKDNCLTRPYGHDLHPPFKDAWKRCRDVYKDQVIIVSNSAGTKDDQDHQLAKAIETSLSVPVLRHEQKKPSGGDELLRHFSGIKPSRVAIVGDRALTDVVFGNNYGMFTILTRDVVTEEGDNPMAIRVS